MASNPTVDRVAARINEVTLKLKLGQGDQNMQDQLQVAELKDEFYQLIAQHNNQDFYSRLKKQYLYSFTAIGLVAGICLALFIVTNPLLFGILTAVAIGIGMTALVLTTQINKPSIAEVEKKVSRICETLNLISPEDRKPAEDINNAPTITLAKDRPVYVDNGASGALDVCNALSSGCMMM